MTLLPDGWGTPSLDGGSQQVAGLGDTADPGASAEVGTLEVDRVRALKASRGALEEADQAGVRPVADVVQGDTDGQVVEGVLVEVVGEDPLGQRLPEPVALLGDVPEPVVALEQRAAGSGQPAGRAVHGADRAGVDHGADVLAGDADGQVVEVVAVVEAGGQGRPELVAGLLRPAGLPLGHRPRAAGGDAAGLAPVHGARAP